MHTSVTRAEAEVMGVLGAGLKVALTLKGVHTSEGEGLLPTYTHHPAQPSFASSVTLFSLPWSSSLQSETHKGFSRIVGSGTQVISGLLQDVMRTISPVTLYTTVPIGDIALARG
jgi:hypothetical protein